MFLGPKADIGDPRVGQFSHFGRFLMIRKIVVFLMSSWDAKKSTKCDLGAPIGRHVGIAPLAVVPLSGPRVPIQQRRRID